jgi:hypothetical protein
MRWMNCVMSRPASGMERMHDPITYPSATGITCVTPSPESTTVPVRFRSLASRLVHDAARASTAWTAMYMPGTLNVSNITSAVYSRFSGGFIGGSVCNAQKTKQIRVQQCLVRVGTSAARRRGNVAKATKHTMLPSWFANARAQVHGRLRGVDVLQHCHSNAECAS